VRVSGSSGLRNNYNILCCVVLCIQYYCSEVKVRVSIFIFSNLNKIFNLPSTNIVIVYTPIELSISSSIPNYSQV
jgi:hypothetical protein